jgi:hypothetical protein
MIDQLPSSIIIHIMANVPPNLALLGLNRAFSAACGVAWAMMRVEICIFSRHDQLATLAASLPIEGQLRALMAAYRDLLDEDRYKRCNRVMEIYGQFMHRYRSDQLFNYFINARLKLLDGPDIPIYSLKYRDLIRYCDLWADLDHRWPNEGQQGAILTLFDHLLAPCPQGMDDETQGELLSIIKRQLWSGNYTFMPQYAPIRQFIRLYGQMTIQSGHDKLGIFRVLPAILSSKSFIEWESLDFLGQLMVNGYLGESYICDMLKYWPDSGQLYSGKSRMVSSYIG